MVGVGGGGFTATSAYKPPVGTKYKRKTAGDEYRIILKNFINSLQEFREISKTGVVEISCGGGGKGEGSAKIIQKRNFPPIYSEPESTVVCCLALTTAKTQEQYFSVLAFGCTGLRSLFFNLAFQSFITLKQKERRKTTATAANYLRTMEFSQEQTLISRQRC